RSAYRPYRLRGIPVPAGSPQTMEPMKLSGYVEKAQGRGRFVVSLSPNSALFVFFARISLLFAEKEQTKTGRR
ncbi:hypothetical protein, partial [Faecalibaculum rodentium]|uniref:hypothetical protein n=1 Tax=Faecalibaculum rodentium TaxID=1702221 RepID=UPI0026F40789